MNCHQRCPFSRKASPAQTSPAGKPRLVVRRAPRAAHQLPRLSVVTHVGHEHINAAIVEEIAAPVQVVPETPHQQQHADTAAAIAEPVALQQEISRLQLLSSMLQQTRSKEQQVELLWSYPIVQEQMQSTMHMQQVARVIQQLSLGEQYVLCCTIAIGQSHLFQLPAEGDTAAALRTLAACLQRVDHFYDSMGGLPGYQLRSLQLIQAGLVEAAEGSHAQQDVEQGTLHGCSSQQKEQVLYHVPKGLDLAGEGGPAPGQAAALAGLLALPQTAEIYPVGGAGDRLGLKCDVTGECLPAAVLPYCGRALLEGLVRDLQAREHLFYRLTGEKTVTPAAVMTSDAKGNHQRIVRLLEESNWFGRGKDAFRLFRQPLVPVLSAEDGKWLLEGAFTPTTKPGGHGAIWKLMHDEGVFDWLVNNGRQAALLRQISNPIAGTDTTMLALAGEGVHRQAAMGFMSCERAVGAAEGMNVLQERRQWVEDESGGHWEYQYGVTNVEYTEFEKLGISDEAVGGTGHSVFPANTNILYIGLEKVKEAVEKAVASGGDAVLPGLIFNLKKQVTYHDPITGTDRKLIAGRMETTMQNLADSLTDAYPAPLDPSSLPQLSTFLVHNLRRKVTSSAKKKHTPGSRRIAQTPDGSFFDLMRNAWQLLQMCGMKHVPELGTVDDYLARGPSFIFLYHPALGPLWDVIAQKVRGGRMEAGSELMLEIAEARLVDVQLDGSLLVTAMNPMGHHVGTTGQLQVGKATAGSAAGASGRTFSFQMNGGDGENEVVVHGLGGRGGGRSAAAPVFGREKVEEEGGRLVYSDHCGRVNLENVRVINGGVDWEAPNTVFWKHQVHRKESVQIILHGRSEFDARDVTLLGSWTFEVPDGYRMVVSTAPAGGIQKWLFPLQDDQPSWWWEYQASSAGTVQLRYRKGYAMDLFPTAPDHQDQFVLDWVI